MLTAFCPGRMGEHSYRIHIKARLQLDWRSECVGLKLEVINSSASLEWLVCNAELALGESTHKSSQLWWITQPIPPQWSYSRRVQVEGDSTDDQRRDHTSHLAGNVSWSQKKSCRAENMWTWTKSRMESLISKDKECWSLWFTVCAVVWSEVTGCLWGFRAGRPAVSSKRHQWTASVIIIKLSVTPKRKQLIWFNLMS